MGLEGQLRGIGVCKVRKDDSGVLGSARSAQEQAEKKNHGYLRSVEKPKAQLRGTGVRKVSSSASAKKKKKKKSHGHLGSVEKPKAYGFGRTAQGYWGPQG
ncbi:unnamed protein product [Prunus brigantina]